MCSSYRSNLVSIRWGEEEEEKEEVKEKEGSSERASSHWIVQAVPW